MNDESRNRAAKIIITLMVIGFIFGAMAGCATMTDEERYDYNLETRVLWNLCRDRREIAQQWEWIRVSGGRLKPSHMQMRHELAMNHCSMKLP